jgi:Mg-chelatase subunit ChlD
MLYDEVRKVFASHPIANSNNPWYVSGIALQNLSELDHEALFAAKRFYKGDSLTIVSTEKIDAALREVIAREYENMKGIEKYGRNNGLCPYTPYEDLPETSRRLSEKLKNLKPTNNYYGRHPYEDLVYLYNDIVDDHNKFSELSRDIFLLKTVHQPELFFVKYPDPEKPQTAAEQKPELKRNEGKTTSTTTNDQKLNQRVIRDTVYIEKRDTIYLTDADGDIRSMEGYATNNMVLLVDVSGSMNTAEKLPVLKQSVLSMLSMMRQEDEVALIIFSGKAKVVLKPVSFKEEAKIREAITDLQSSGKTDANAGIKLAYKVADENYIRGGNNRIVLATDGEFPLSESTEALIKTSASQDIYLTIFNFGKKTASAKKLERLANLGRGNYEYISKENVEVKLIREVKGRKKK